MTTTVAGEPVRNARRSNPTLDVVLVAMFAALTAVMGLIPPITVGILPVPITLQTLAVMLAGALLGPWRGALSQVLLIALVAAGLPLLAGGRGGMGALLGPTGGYIFGWVLGALVIGLITVSFYDRARAAWINAVILFAACIVGGVLVVYLMGSGWLSMTTGMDIGTALKGNVVFIPGDTAKAVIATAVALLVHRSYRGLLAK
ncbi:biotin transporter BioY [Pseudoglutamicibacter albus]|uniref:Biotin transporter n=1 Tax=Pseudoglutamicibacter albus TaxID=98671 RepID=A0ABU1Z1L3_9MICC|nr:biotin transporter BioY [Pseudoglutamicibacter albus]MDR7294509.1 biotin transport system substrate-specific component [Pseudoglutamicibacter albus]